MRISPELEQLFYVLFIVDSNQRWFRGTKWIMPRKNRQIGLIDSTCLAESKYAISIKLCPPIQELRPLLCKLAFIFF
jgi:hypothetical protein